MSDEEKFRRRSSSILKPPKSPRQALQQLENTEPNTQEKTLSKLERRASRRVSFADTCQVQEFCKEVSSHVSSAEMHCPGADILDQFMVSAPTRMEPALSSQSVLPPHHFLLTGPILYQPLSAPDTSKDASMVVGKASDVNGASAPICRVPLKTIDPEELQRESERNQEHDSEESPLDATFFASPNPGDASLDNDPRSAAQRLTVYFDDQRADMEMTTANDFSIYMSKRAPEPDVDGCPLKNPFLAPEPVDCEVRKAPVARQRTVYFSGEQAGMELTTVNDVSILVANLPADFADASSDSDQVFLPNDHPAATDASCGESLLDSSAEIERIILAGCSPTDSESGSSDETSGRDKSTSKAVLDADGSATEDQGDMELTDANDFPIVVACEDAGKDPEIRKRTAGGGAMLGLVRADSDDFVFLDDSKAPWKPSPLCSTARDGEIPVKFSVSTLDASSDRPLDDPSDDGPLDVADSPKALQPAVAFEHGNTLDDSVPLADSLNASQPAIALEHRDATDDAEPPGCLPKASRPPVAVEHRNTLDDSVPLADSLNASQPAIAQEHRGATDDAEPPGCSVPSADLPNRPSVGAGKTIRFEGPSADMNMTFGWQQSRMATVASRAFFDGSAADMELCDASSLAEASILVSETEPRSRSVREISEPGNTATDKIEVLGSKVEHEMGALPVKAADDGVVNRAEDAQTMVDGPESPISAGTQARAEVVVETAASGSKRSPDSSEVGGQSAPNGLALLDARCSTGLADAGLKSKEKDLEEPAIDNANADNFKVSDCERAKVNMAIPTCPGERDRSVGKLQEDLDASGSTGLKSKEEDLEEPAIKNANADSFKESAIENANADSFKESDYQRAKVNMAIPTGPGEWDRSVVKLQEDLAADDASQDAAAAKTAESGPRTRESPDEERHGEAKRSVLQPEETEEDEKPEEAARLLLQAAKTEEVTGLTKNSVSKKTEEVASRSNEETENNPKKMLSPEENRQGEARCSPLPVDKTEDAEKAENAASEAKRSLLRVDNKTEKVEDVTSEVKHLLLRGEKTEDVTSEAKRSILHADKTEDAEKAEEVTARSDVETESNPKKKLSPHENRQGEARCSPLPVGKTEDAEKAENATSEAKRSLLRADKKTEKVEDATSEVKHLLLRGEKTGDTTSEANRSILHADKTEGAEKAEVVTARSNEDSACKPRKRPSPDKDQGGEAKRSHSERKSQALHSDKTEALNSEVKRSLSVSKAKAAEMMKGETKCLKKTKKYEKVEGAAGGVKHSLSRSGKTKAVLPQHENESGDEAVTSESPARSSREYDGVSRKRPSPEGNQPDAVPRKHAAVDAEVAPKTLGLSRSIALKSATVRYGFSQPAKPEEPRPEQPPRADDREDVDDCEDAVATVQNAVERSAQDSVEDLMDISCPTLVSGMETSVFAAEDERDATEPSAAGSEDTEHLPSVILDSPPIANESTELVERSSPVPESQLLETVQPRRQQPLMLDRLQALVDAAKSGPKKYKRKVAAATMAEDAVVTTAEDAAATVAETAEETSGKKETPEEPSGPSFQDRVNSLFQNLAGRAAATKGLGQGAVGSQDGDVAAAGKMPPKDCLEPIRAAAQLLKAEYTESRRQMEAQRQRLKEIDSAGLRKTAQEMLRMANETKAEYARMRERANQMQVDDGAADIAALMELVKPRPRVKKQPRSKTHNVDEWSSEQVHLTFCRDELHLKFGLGDLISAEETEWEDGEQQENRVIRTVQKWCTVKDDADPVVRMAHRYLWQAFEREDLEATCKSTRRLRQILPTLIVYTEDAMGLLWDVKRAGFLYIIDVDKTEVAVTVDFVDLDAYLNFKLKFTVEPGSYPNRRLRPQLEKIIGQMRSEDLDAVLRAVDVGPSYLYRMVCAVDQWLISQRPAKS